MEGSHAALKSSGYLTTRVSIESAFNVVDNYIKKQYLRQKVSCTEESIKVDAIIRQSNWMKDLVGQISAYALMQIHMVMLQLLEIPEDKRSRLITANRNCYKQRSSRLPCVHTILYKPGPLGSLQQIKRSSIDKRWHLIQDAVIPSQTESNIKTVSSGNTNAMTISNDDSSKNEKHLYSSIENKQDGVEGSTEFSQVASRIELLYR